MPSSAQGYSENAAGDGGLSIAFLISNDQKG
jgi:hypothetical protein